MPPTVVNSSGVSSPFSRDMLAGKLVRAGLDGKTALAHADTLAAIVDASGVDPISTNAIRSGLGEILSNPGSPDVPRIREALQGSQQQSNQGNRHQGDQGTPHDGQIALPYDPHRYEQADASFNHFWQNWSKTHAFVAQKMFFPRSVYELAWAVSAAEVDGVPLRAVGGGWSFSDASLPGAVATDRPDAARLELLAEVLGQVEGPRDGAPAVDVIDVSRSFPSLGQSQPAMPYVLGRPQPEAGYLINTRSLVSSLQQNLSNILSAEAADATSPAPKKRGAEQRFYFHVEAGISMDELGQLLNHQSPRLSLQASGGNPGATLAGSLASATHGAEFNWPLLVDRVKAIHLVGPGGLQWWIEGDDSIADPKKLLAAYPYLAKDRIICGRDRIHGIRPQDWLNAVTVSMGCMGAVYSVVLEVSPLDGQHQKTIQLTWQSLLAKVAPRVGIHDDINDFIGRLRNGPAPKGYVYNPDPAGDDNSSDPLDSTGPHQKPRLGRNVDPYLAPGVAERFSLSLWNVLMDGAANGTGIARGDATSGNQYADLAFNPIALVNGDYDCWIMNREMVPLPFDPQPAGGSDMLGDIINGLGRAFNNRQDLIEALLAAFGFKKPDPGWTIAVAFFSTFLPIPTFTGPDPFLSATLGALTTVAVPLAQAVVNLIGTVGATVGAKDLYDTMLSAVFTPIGQQGPSGVAVSQAILTGFLSGLLGTANDQQLSESTGGSVGSIGFPDSGLMGTGIEIALDPKDAFQFLQLTILDKLPRDKPFLGYISIRICPKTDTLLGMQQFGPHSVMIEVVAFGDPAARAFVNQLQADTVAQMKAGLNAMLHWGLENDQLTGDVLKSMAIMKKPTSDDANAAAMGDWLGSPGRVLNKYEAFGVVRDILRGGNGLNGSGLFSVFDNNFTARCGFSPPVKATPAAQIAGPSSIAVPWNTGTKRYPKSVSGTFTISPVGLGTPLQVSWTTPSGTSSGPTVKVAFAVDSANLTPQHLSAQVSDGSHTVSAGLDVDFYLKDPAEPDPRNPIHKHLPDPPDGGA